MRTIIAIDEYSLDNLSTDTPQWVMCEGGEQAEYLLRIEFADDDVQASSYGDARYDQGTQQWIAAVPWGTYDDDRFATMEEAMNVIENDYADASREG